MIPSQTISHERLGIVKIVTRSNARKLTARWKDGYVQVTGPSACSQAEFSKALESLVPQLLACKPAGQYPEYCDGFSFKTDDWCFVLRCSATVKPMFVQGRRLKTADGTFAYEILVAPDTDFSSQGMRKAIGTVVKRIARTVASAVLIDQARQEAAALGLADKVAGWEIGRGRRRLGLCDNHGVISLSLSLMFMPRDLRRSTITHELAHLTHFDHSPAFYALWDKYLGYSHTVSKARVKAMKFPVPHS